MEVVVVGCVKARKEGRRGLEGQHQGRDVVVRGSELCGAFRSHYSIIIIR
jgi:hypothetical protein